jgi:dipeptidyl aminopeptidase/acylaminoacyl peptidase
MRLLRFPLIAALPVVVFALVFAASFAYFRATDADTNAKAAASSAGPTSTAGGGRLVVALHAVGLPEPAEAYLASVAVDGSDVREITQPPEGGIAADGSPSVSPDGKTIVFSRAIPGEPPHIYLVGVDGSRLRRFTQGNLAEIQPVWSPDGTRIAFSRAHGEHFDLFVAGADGSGLTQLTHTPLADEDSCTWSPNGLQLAFTRFQNDDEDVLAINVDGTEQHPLIRGPHDDASPAWSPEGSRIAIARDGRIAVFSFEHFKVAFLTETGTKKDTGPNWSPDGSRIVFTRDPGTIFVMNADGSKLVEVPLDKPGTAAAWEPAR